jgi:hypothetical protein
MQLGFGLRNERIIVRNSNGASTSNEAIGPFLCAPTKAAESLEEQSSVFELIGHREDIRSEPFRTREHVRAIRRTHSRDHKYKAQDRWC